MPPVKVHMLTESGVDVYLDFASLEVAKSTIDRLLQEGYKPVSPPSANGHAATGHLEPTGPTCPKHGIPLQRRSKYGETWHSHPIPDSTGTVRYCRGHAWKPGDGWDVERKDA